MKIFCVRVGVHLHTHPYTHACVSLFEVAKKKKKSWKQK